MEKGNVFRVKYEVESGEPTYYKVEDSKEGIRMMRVFANRDRIDFENISNFLCLEVFIDDHWEVWKNDEGNLATDLIENI